MPTIGIAAGYNVTDGFRRTALRPAPDIPPACAAAGTMPVPTIGAAAQHSAPPDMPPAAAGTIPVPTIGIAAGYNVIGGFPRTALRPAPNMPPAAAGTISVPTIGTATGHNTTYRFRRTALRPAPDMPPAAAGTISVPPACAAAGTIPAPAAVTKARPVGPLGAVNGERAAPDSWIRRRSGRSGLRPSGVGRYRSRLRRFYANYFYLCCNERDYAQREAMN